MAEENVAWPMLQQTSSLAAAREQLGLAKNNHTKSPQPRPENMFNNWSKDDIAIFEAYVAGVKGALPGDTEALFTLRGLRAVKDMIVQRMAPSMRAMTALEACMEAVKAEVERAQKLHPVWPSDPLHALAILGEEFGELTRAMVQLTYETEKVSSPACVAEEALQTAAMALRLMLHLNDYLYLQQLSGKRPT
jgi:hypothetical protein